MGRGLIRLYLVLWGLLIAFSVATNYKELATYVGYERWTLEKAFERAEAYVKSKCKEDELSKLDMKCIYPGAVFSDDYVTDAQVEITIWMFKNAIFKAPFYFLVILVVLYWLVKWVIAGFQRKQ